MKFDLDHSIVVLERTPAVLQALLAGIPGAWADTQGDIARWQPFDVIGHLIHGEKTDWIPRAAIILDDGGYHTLEPFDRMAQFSHSENRTLEEMLVEFAELRASSLSMLRNWNLTSEQLARTGVHPELGEVRLEQLIATWVVHDLNHIKQIVTAMADKYQTEVGPWRQYLSILN